MIDDEKPQELPLPSGFANKDDCPSCKKWNSAKEVELTERGVICYFHCDCGCDHGIVHTGGYISSYKAFLEELKKEEDKEIVPS